MTVTIENEYTYLLESIAVGAGIDQLAALLQQCKALRVCLEDGIDSLRFIGNHLYSQQWTTHNNKHTIENSTLLSNDNPHTYMIFFQYSVTSCTTKGVVPCYIMHQL